MIPGEPLQLVVGKDGGGAVDRRGIIWRKRFAIGIIASLIAFDLGPVLCQLRLEAEQDDRPQCLVTIGELHGSHQAALAVNASGEIYTPAS